MSDIIDFIVELGLLICLIVLVARPTTDTNTMIFCGTMYLAMVIRHGFGGLYDRDWR